MRVLSFFLFISLLVCACKPASQSDNAATATPADEVKALEAQVMAIHDTLMTKMSDITRLTAELRLIKSKLAENEEGKIESPAGLEEAMGSLKLAEQGMWDWMKFYTDTKPTIPEDQLKSFYEKQLETINKVSQDMLGSIDKAQAWLAANGIK
jgi:hypothetical protein